MICSELIGACSESATIWHFTRSRKKTCLNPHSSMDSKFPCPLAMMRSAASRVSRNYFEQYLRETPGTPAPVSISGAVIPDAIAS